MVVFAIIILAFGIGIYTLVSDGDISIKEVLVVAALILMGIGVWFGWQWYANNIITVKYREDSVNVAGENFVSLEDNGLGNVGRLWYDDSKDYMIIELNGVNYHYCAVGEAAFRPFKSTALRDRYYEENIKGRYDCRINPAPSY